MNARHLIIDKHITNCSECYYYSVSKVIGMGIVMCVHKDRKDSGHIPNGCKIPDWCPLENVSDKSM